MLEQLIAAIDTRKKALREVSDALWNNPETAYKEFFAAETASAFLEKCGFSENRICITAILTTFIISIPAYIFYLP